MSIEHQYKRLLEKVGNRSDMPGALNVLKYCTKTASIPASSLLTAAAVGALPAYLVGSQVGKDEERKKHRNYALGGAAVGYLAPKILGTLLNPSSVADSVAGIDADYIKSLQLQDIE